MNINASNQSLVNILLQQAAKTKDKKRPTFEEVFTKLNARTSKMNPNKTPMNNMLTNEQLFRYYLKDTAPKLQISNESFNIEDALNPMKESDPNKVYGSATTQTGNIPSRNPYNNAENIAQIPQQSINAPRPSASRTPTLRTSSLSIAIPTYNPKIPTAASAPAAASAPVAPAAAAAPAVIKAPSADIAEVYTNMTDADVIYRQAINAIDKFSTLEWASIPDGTNNLFKIFFSPNYEEYSAYYLSQIIKTGNYENTITGLFDIFYQSKNNKSANDFIKDKIKGMVGADFSYGAAVEEEFNALYNPNNVSVQEFMTNIAEKLSKSFFTSAEMARMDRDLALIDTANLKELADNYVGNAEQNYYNFIGQYNVLTALTQDPIDPFELFNKAAENDRNAEAVFEGLMDELFTDTATEFITDTGINSNKLDEQIKSILLSRPPRTSPLTTPIISISPTPSSATAEASSGSVDISNVSRPRGVQQGAVRGPYATSKKIAGDILGDIIGTSVDIAETIKKKKKK